MSANVMSIHPVDAEILISKNFNMLEVLKDKSGIIKVIVINPPSAIDICTKFNDNQSSSCQDQY